jgi:hypothetical protein
MPGNVDVEMPCPPGLPPEDLFLRPPVQTTSRNLYSFSSYESLHEIEYRPRQG